MKKSFALAVGVAMLAAVTLCGCGTMCGPSAEDQVRAVVNEWVATVPEQDVDALMALYSEDFEHWEYGDKEGFAQFIEEAISMGYMDDAKSDVEDMEVQFDDEKDTATVYPIDLTAAFGMATIELILEEDDGEWKITGMDIEQY